MANESLGIRIGLIGFGEVGSSLAAGLRSEGVQHLLAYNRGYQTSPSWDLIQRRAREAGVPLLGSVRELVEASDLVLVAVPGSAALEAAASAAAGLKAGQMYADLGTASPPAKAKMAGLVEATGAAFVDVAIMGLPLKDRHRVATIASGGEARRYRDLVTPLGMKVTLVGNRPGRAAAIKMFRSIFMKGIEALTIETLMACQTWGVADDVMSTVAASLGQMPYYPDHANLMVGTHAIHAERRAHEMDMVIETMEEMGIEPRMTRATAAMFHWTASLGLREQFGGEVPADWRAVLDEIFRRLGKE